MATTIMQGSSMDTQLQSPSLQAEDRNETASVKLDLQKMLTPGVTEDLLMMVTDADRYIEGRSYTPETDVGQIPEAARPDVALFCDQCQQFVNVSRLYEHRNYHRALGLLGYRGTARPIDVPELLERRKRLIKAIRTSEGTDGGGGGDRVDQDALGKLNAAFELLKSNLEQTFEEYRRIRQDPVDLDVRAVALTCSTRCAFAVGICNHGNERWKGAMEDARVFQDYYGNDENKCFFAIYDGHHGRFAAELAANELHSALLMEMEKFDPRTKCTCSFNMADSYDLSQYHVAEIHSRAPSQASERGAIHEVSANAIQQIIQTCETHLENLKLYDDISAKADADDPGHGSDRTTADSNPQEGSKATTPLDDGKTSKSEKGRSGGKSKRRKDPFAEKMARAARKAHRYTDTWLSYGKDEMSKVRWSGCSTLTCVIQNTQVVAHVPEEAAEKVFGEAVDSNRGDVSRDQLTGSEQLLSVPISEKATPAPPREQGVIHLSNAGNVRALLIRANRPYRLTKDHTPANPKERIRVLKAGGTISDSHRELRVNGVLATTRGLGNHGDSSLKRCVLGEPHTTSVSIDQYAQFLVLASHGLWEVFSDQDVTSLLLQTLPSHNVPPPSSMSTSLGRIWEEAERRRNQVSPSRTSTSRLTGNQSPKLDATPRDLDSGKTIAQSPGAQSTRPATSRSKQSVTVDEEKNDWKTFHPEEVAGLVVDESCHEEATNHRDDVTQSGDNGHLDDADAGEKRHVGTNMDNGDAASTEATDSHCGDFDTEAGDSGNEADLDTDIFTIGDDTQRSPTRRELQRDMAKALSQHLVQAALMAGAKDNITVMVILLPGCGL